MAQKKQLALWGKKIVLCSAGYAVNAVGISLFLRAGLGVDPVSVFEDGLAGILHVQFGTAALITMLCLLAFGFAFARKYIGFGTVYSVAVLGPFVNVAQGALEAICPRWPASGSGRLVCMLLGFLLLCVGCAVVVGTRFGYNITDVMLFYLHDNTRYQYRWLKVASDWLFVLVGFLMGGTAGIGTVFSALCGGPVITRFVQGYDQIVLASLGLSDMRNRFQPPDAEEPRS